MTGKRDFNVTGDYHESHNKGQQAGKDIINNVIQFVIQGSDKLESLFSEIGTNIGSKFHTHGERYEESENIPKLKSKITEIQSEIERLNRNSNLVSDIQKQQIDIEIKRLEIAEKEYELRLEEYRRRVEQEEARQYTYPLSQKFSKVRNVISSHPQAIWIIPIPVEDKSNSDIFTSLDIEVKTRLQNLILLLP
jgi:hypothetical protein